MLFSQGIISILVYDNMLIIALFISFVLHLSTTTGQPYTPTDYILLDCGSSSNTSSGGRNWQSDAFSAYLPPNAETISITSNVFAQGTSTKQVPYMTARIFHSQFTYTFPEFSTGAKFIRLYFYPSTYSTTLNISDSVFSVIANNYTLLSKFSAFLTVSYTPKSQPTLMKEYIVNINDDRQLNITFLPSPNSFAFVNGIELVSIPDKLYYPGEDVSFLFIGQSNPFYIGNNRAFETAYRLNVGGESIPVTSDTGMFREWKHDKDNMFGAVENLYDGDFRVSYTSDTPVYTAPESVYTSASFMDHNYTLNYNMSWYFPVDSGFYYLIRLHFCEFIYSQVNERVFTIFINNQTAEAEFDVIAYVHAIDVALKRDYVAYVEDPDGSLSKQDLWLDMHPNPDSKSHYYSALLNGVEIFKLSRPNGSLVSPNPLPVSNPSKSEQSTLNRKKKTKSWRLILFSAGGVIGGLGLLICFLSFLIFLLRRRGKESGTSFLQSLCGTTAPRRIGGSVSAVPLDGCRQFSLAEIKYATDNFDDKFVIGVGGFGTVYKGYTENGALPVAVKRLNPISNQGIQEFLTEIGMLSKLRHLHLVLLIGFCDDNGEMILVYDYMPRGTLRDHLYKTRNPPLPWKQRLQICIGTAKGLLYLHTSAKQKIIHRDVKSTNILLDEKWVAKVSDFGLSKTGPNDGIQAYVSTAVKGSFGYMDPEYFLLHQLTEKSDVYSFGVVLFEVLCARPVIIQNLPEEQVSLAEWAQYCYRNETLDQIIDANLKDEIAPECLDKYVEIAIRCLKEKGTERPAMNEVVWSLEFSLKLQVVAEKTSSIMKANDYITIPYFDMLSMPDIATSSSSKMSDGFKSPETVFTEIMNPSGR